MIYTPPHYARSNQHYPVLYLLDAEAQFYQAAATLQFLGSDNGRIPEMILVGITNTRRIRDLTPTTQDPEQRKHHPDAGGADAFLKFLTDELTPWVNARYRTQPYRILVGHSLGGLFAVHALLVRPDSFQAYLAVSPSLWWDAQATVTEAKTALGTIPVGPHALYLSWGANEHTIRDSSQALLDWLQAHPSPTVQVVQPLLSG